METTLSGMTGRGSIGRSNRRFYTLNVDCSRTHLNITYCNDNLKAEALKKFAELFRGGR